MKISHVDECRPPFSFFKVTFSSGHRQAVAEWLSSWLAEQEVRGSIPRLATRISEIGYLPLPSRDMAEIPLKRRKSSIKPNQKPTKYFDETGQIATDKKILPISDSISVGRLTFDVYM